MLTFRKGFQDFRDFEARVLHDATQRKLFTVLIDEAHVQQQAVRINGVFPQLLRHARFYIIELRAKINYQCGLDLLQHAW